jgi:hypothetical protein
MFNLKIIEAFITMWKEPKIYKRGVDSIIS